MTVTRGSAAHATRHTTRIPPFEIRFLAALPLLFNDFLDFLVFIVVVLTGVGDFVFEYLDELVEDDGDDGAGCGAHPVDPVFVVEDAGYDAGAEGAGGVERAAGVVDADEFCDEESEADADGGDEGCWKVLVGGKGRMMGRHTFMLLLCQHEDGKDQFGGEDSFYEDTLGQTCALTQRSPHIEGCGEQDADEETGKDTSADLRCYQQEGADRRQSAAEQHGERHGGIEQTTADTEEDPYVYHERESEDESDVEQDNGRETSGFVGRSVGVGGGG